MSTYANGFNCTVNADKTETVITFFQHTPVINGEGKLDGSSRETVATLIMTGTTAMELGDTLVKLLKEQQ